MRRLRRPDDVGSNELDVFLENFPNLSPGTRLVLGIARERGGFRLPQGAPTPNDRLWVLEFLAAGGVALSEHRGDSGSATGWRVLPAAVGIEVASAGPLPVLLTRTNPDGSPFSSARFNLELRLRVAAAPASHPLSEFGPALPGSTDCVEKVWTLDPFCVDNTWDALCGSEAQWACLGGDSGDPSRLSEPFPQNARFVVAQLATSPQCPPLDFACTEVRGSYPYRPDGTVTASVPESPDLRDTGTWRWLSQTPPSRPLRVATWNIKRFTDDSSLGEGIMQPTVNDVPDFFQDSAVDACAIGTRIANSRYDIIALEEAWDEAETYQVLRCANLRRVAMADPSGGGLTLGPYFTTARVSDMRVVHDVASSLATGTAASSVSDHDVLAARGVLATAIGQAHGGVVLLSAYPIASESHHVYEACKAEECLVQKGILHARIHVGATPDALPPLPADQLANFSRGPFTPAPDDYVDVFATHTNAPYSTSCGMPTSVLATRVRTLLSARGVDPVTVFGLQTLATTVINLVAAFRIALSGGTITVSPAEAAAVLTSLHGERIVVAITQIVATVLQQHCGVVEGPATGRSFFDGEDDEASSSPESRANWRLAAYWEIALVMYEALSTGGAAPPPTAFLLPVKVAFDAALGGPPPDEVLSNTEIIRRQFVEAAGFINTVRNTLGGKDQPALVLGDLNTDEGYPGAPMFPTDPDQARPTGHANLVTNLGALSFQQPWLAGAVDGAVTEFELSATPPGSVVPLLARFSSVEEPDVLVDLNAVLAARPTHPGRFRGSDAAGLTFIPASHTPRDLRDVYGTDLTSPASRLQSAGLADADFRGFHNGQASKLDYILQLVPEEFPRFIFGRPTGAVATSPVVFRSLDVDPSTPVPSASARTMSDHLLVEASLTRYRISHLEVFDSRRATNWTVQASTVQCIEGCDDGFAATLDLFGHLWQQRQSTEGSYGTFPATSLAPTNTCDYRPYLDVSPPFAEAVTLSTLGDDQVSVGETSLRAHGWRTTFRIGGRVPGASGAEARWAVGNAILDRDIASENDIYDVGFTTMADYDHGSPRVDDGLMRFGYDSFGGANVFGMVNGAGDFVSPRRVTSPSWRLVNDPINILRVPDGSGGTYLVEDAGDGTTCIQLALPGVTAHNRALARWSVSFTYDPGR